MARCRGILAGVLAIGVVATLGAGTADARRHDETREVSAEEDNPPGCTTAGYTNDEQCGAQGRSDFASADHVPPIEACATEQAASGSTITRILPDGPRLADGTLAFIPGACVYLPPGYATSGLRYPVLYLLHGGGGDQGDWVTQGDVQAIADAAAAADPDDALIVVMPDGRSGQWYDSKDRTLRNEAYVLDHLVPYVDATFRTIADRRGRAIAGLSNGGYGAFHLAAEAPDLFVAAGAMSGNLAARSMGGLGTPVVEGGPAFQEAGAHYYGSIPIELAPNLDPVDLIVDWGARCESDVTVDACGTFAFEQAFADANRAFRDRLAEVGYTGTLDYRETEGSHAWRWWQLWLRERHLPFVLDRLADPDPGPSVRSPIPRRFRYRSIAPRFDVFGYRVEVERDVLEFLDLLTVTKRRIEVQGSGTATITTAARYQPRAAYDVSGQVVRADRRGRLRLVVDLGPSHEHEQYSPAARPQQDLPGYFTRRTLTIRRAE